LDEFWQNVFSGTFADFEAFVAHVTDEIQLIGCELGNSNISNIE
jgi:hypothetical protein